MISVLITDDHPIVRQGIRQILEDDFEQRFGQVDEACNGKELLDKLNQRHYDVVLLDISLPGRTGLELIPDIRKFKQPPAIVVISIYSDESYAMRALKLGASGYITKASAPEELVKATIKAARGEKYLASDLAEKITIRLLSQDDKPLHEQLSAREIEIVRLLGSGLTLSEVALTLNISPKTVSTYRGRILSKLQLKSTAEIIKYSIENKFPLNGTSL